MSPYSLYSSSSFTILPTRSAVSLSSLCSVYSGMVDVEVEAVWKVSSLSSWAFKVSLTQVRWSKFYWYYASKFVILVMKASMSPFREATVVLSCNTLVSSCPPAAWNLYTVSFTSLVASTRVLCWLVECLSSCYTQLL